MLKKVLTVFALFSAITVSAQTSIDQVLSIIESNNKTLSTSSHFAEAQKAASRVGNSLYNPEVSYSYLFPGPSSVGSSRELVVTQPFDFPTVYTNKNQLSKLRDVQSDANHSLYRQSLLLSAKQLCLELVSLLKQRALIDERVFNAQSLKEHYEKRLNIGDANAIETSKIALELVNVKSERYLNEAAIGSALQQLATLNGGTEIKFNIDNYSGVELVGSFEDLMVNSLTHSVALDAATAQVNVAQREVKLNKSLAMPKLSLGFRRDYSLTDNFNGVAFGMSIPMFESRFTVKSAKANEVYYRSLLESDRIAISQNMITLYDESQVLATSISELSNALNTQSTLTLLRRALEAGEISVIAYFVEVSSLFEARKNLILLEDRYYKLNAEMLKHKL